MFIAEEFYDVKMIEQLKLLDQILSFSTLKYCRRLFILPKKQLFLVPSPPHDSYVAFIVTMKHEKLICSSELIMYKLACGFSLHFSRTFYECFVCMDGRPQRVCPLVCMIHKPKRPESWSSRLLSLFIWALWQRTSALLCTWEQIRKVCFHPIFFLLYIFCNLSCVWNCWSLQ